MLVKNIANVEHLFTILWLIKIIYCIYWYYVTEFI